MKIERLHRAVLYGFVFLLHFEYWDLLGTASFLTITKLFGFLYFAFALRDIRRFFSFAPVKVFLIPVFIFYGFLTVVSLLNYDSLYHHFTYIVDFSAFQCILLFWVLANHLREQPQVAYRTLVAFVAGGVLTGLMYYMGVGVTMVEGRLSMFGDDQNAVGIRMTLAVIVALSLIFENPLQWKAARFLLFASLPFLLPVLALTGSRTALICLGLGLIILILFIKMQRAMKIGFVIVSIAGVSVMVSYFAQFDTIQERLASSIKDGDNAGRTKIWQHVVPIFYESPLWGVGTTGYAKRVIPIFGVNLKGNYRSPHNLYLEILCYTGIIGLSFFLWFMIRVLIKSIQVYLRGRYILPVILLLLILIDMSVGQGLYNKIFWYCYAFIVALQAGGTAQGQYRYGMEKTNCDG